MPKSTRTHADVERDLRRLTNAMSRMQHWVERCHEMYEAGDLEGAREALRKADYWKARVRAIEASRGIEEK